MCPRAGSLTVGLIRQCQTIHGRERTCAPPQLPPEWITTLLFIVLGIVSLTVTCGLLVMSRWRREAARLARWIAFAASRCSLTSLVCVPGGGGVPRFENVSKPPANVAAPSDFLLSRSRMNESSFIITMNPLSCKAPHSLFHRLLLL